MDVPLLAVGKCCLQRARSFAVLRRASLRCATSPPPCPQPAAMLPLIDMCNHSFDANAKVAPGPGGAMCMVATR